MFQNKCVAIILAGGKSERMRHPKGLLDYKGHFWVLEHLNRLKAAGIRDVILGLGFDAEAYYKAIPELKNALINTITFKGIRIKVVQNKNPELGSFSTLQYALKSLKKPSDVLICPIDVPILNSKELIKMLKIEAHIVKPLFNRQSGHPIKVNYKIVQQILKEGVSNRLDKKIAAYSEKDIKKIICSDKQVIMNLNTPVEWLTYKESL